MPRLRNRKHELFAIEIAAGTPLGTAYVSSGYHDSKFARHNASRLANTPAVKARIDELVAEFAERSAIQKEYLQHKLLPIVEANVQDLFETVEENGQRRERLRSITNLPRNLASAVSKVKLDPETGAVIEITFAGKIEAASVLLRSVGGFIDRQELTGKDGGALTLEQLVIRSFEIERHPANGNEKADEAAPPDAQGHD